MSQEEKRDYRYIFGPVPSRRLGVSLGVDLMPHKTCTLDCIYCECGKTTHLTLARKAYVPVEAVKAELSAFLSTDPYLDFITFSGAGEPTLHSGIQDIVRFIKNQFPQYRVALLTNGTLFDRKEVREAVAEIDLVIASLDAGTASVFQRINRPHPGLDLNSIKTGLIALRKAYPGQLWIEVFLTPGVNDGDDEIQKIREVIAAIQPEKIQLNTLDRPGSEDWIKPLDKKGMDRVAAAIGPTELISSVGTLKAAVPPENIQQRIIAAIRRRPCTVLDISRMLGISEDEALQHLRVMVEQGGVEKKEMPRGVFFFAE